MNIHLCVYKLNIFKLQEMNHLVKLRLLKRLEEKVHVNWHFHHLNDKSGG